MKFALIFILFMSYHQQSLLIEEGKSFLDFFIIPFRKFRQLSQEVLAMQKSKLRVLQSNRLQPVIPDHVPFPCNLRKARSSRKPKSVHKLRPGDIDVIGAIGDSLSVGAGLTATNIFEVMLEERGKTFSGGELSWRECCTLPNILKVFNPNLIGYALNTSMIIQEESQFNVAELGATSADTPFMAKELIRRMNADRRVNVQEDWKMITILIGTNDLCSYICYMEKPENALEKHKNNLLAALRILRDNLPKTIVNLMPTIDLRSFVELKFKPFCYFVHLVACSCMFGLQFEKNRSLYLDIAKRWQYLDAEVGNYPEFDTDDFTVVVQPMTLNYTFPSAWKIHEVDHSYFSEDCVHFSQKLNAKVAIDLWNNVMEPVGHKSVDGSDLFTKFRCPTRRHPYIFTRRNSLVRTSLQ